MAPSPDLFQFHPSTDPRHASLEINTKRRATVPLHPHLLGKFCEHLGTNIYQGMDAQILFNNTFARWRFASGKHPDGGVCEASERDIIRANAEHMGHWPEPNRIVDAYFDGGAWGWFRVGSADAVRLSPDAYSSGGRAQRIELSSASPSTPNGIAQWTHLPLHRTRNYTFRMVARAVMPCVLELRLAPTADDVPIATASIDIGSEWSVYTGRMELPDGCPLDALHTFSIVATLPAHVVIARVSLLPDDHIGGADPDVIRLLREAHLPLLRWPGGNFVSGYHWQDGIGLVDDRPTRHNPAWGGVESNAFGTDEYIAFCRAVGCDPLICVNAASGSPVESAAWVEYCNGSINTTYGSLRAANGHPEPYGVKLWEIGNELYGRWQIGWTTGAGYADRFQRFADEMHQADPSIEIIATGTQGLLDDEWTQALLATHSPHLRCVTDHTLAYTQIDQRDDPWDVYQGYMGQPVIAGQQYRWFRAAMLAAGIAQPHLALTEMQIFASWHAQQESEGEMTRQQMVDPSTIAEAVYFAAYLCESARLDGFINLIAHTATVNHGGGLRKWHEHVWANPIHHCHSLTAPLAGAIPVGVTLTCGAYSTKRAYGIIPILEQVSMIDTVAACTPTGDLVILLISRAREPITLDLRIPGLVSDLSAEIATLTGATPWERNTNENQCHIAPQFARETFKNGNMMLELQPCSVTRVVVNLSIT